MQTQPTPGYKPETITLSRNVTTKTEETFTLPAYMADSRGHMYSVILSKDRMLRVSTFDFAPALSIEQTRLTDYDKPCAKDEVIAAIRKAKGYQREFLIESGLMPITPALSAALQIPEHFL